MKFSLPKGEAAAMVPPRIEIAQAEISRQTASLREAPLQDFSARDMANFANADDPLTVADANAMTERSIRRAREPWKPR